MTAIPNRFTHNRMTFERATRENGKLEAVIKETHGWLDRVTWRVEETTVKDWLAIIANYMEQGLDGPELVRNQVELRIAIHALGSEDDKSKR